MAADKRSFGSRVHARIDALVGRPVFWVLFVAIIFSLPIIRSIYAASQMPDPPPVIGTVPNFTLIDQHQKVVTSAHLRGRAWIANFTYTECTERCPHGTKRMKGIQHRVRGLGDSIQLVTFTVDPKADNHKVLSEYAKKSRASRRRWSFLTGAGVVMSRVLRDGFGIDIDNHGPAEALAESEHGYHFVLVDPAMQIRGYYDLTEDDQVDLLLRDTGLLINRPEPETSR